MAHTNLITDNICESIRSIPAISSMFPGGIYSEAPIGTNITFPYMYIEKYEFVDINNITKRANVTFSIVGNSGMVVGEIEDMFVVIDNNILPDIDGCLPIKIIGDASIVNIKQGIMVSPLRDKLKNIVLRKVYSFSYLIQT